MQLTVSQQRAALSAYLSKKTSQCLHVNDPAKTCFKCPPNKRFVLVSKGDLVLRLWEILVATAFVPHFVLASSQSSSSQVFCRQAAYSSGLHLEVSDKTADYLPKKLKCVWRTLILPRLL